MSSVEIGCCMCVIAVVYISEDFIPARCPKTYSNGKRHVSESTTPSHKHFYSHYATIHSLKGSDNVCLLMFADSVASFNKNNCKTVTLATSFVKKAEKHFLYCLMTRVKTLPHVTISSTILLAMPVVSIVDDGIQR